MADNRHEHDRVSRLGREAALDFDDSLQRRDLFSGLKSFARLPKAC